MDRPVRTAVALAGGGTLHAGTWLGRSVWRAWLPLAVAGSLVSRRVRRATIAAAVVPALLDRRAALRSGGVVDVDPVRWTALHAADDAAYCAGVWRGAVRCRSARALLPRLSGIRGLTGRSESGPGAAGR